MASVRRHSIFARERSIRLSTARVWCPGLVLRGGTPASEYEKISSAVADMEKGGDSAGASVASLSAPAAEQPGQAVPGLPNALHSAATMGDATKLGKLLRALDASGSTPQLNSGDSRRYTVRFRRLLHIAPLRSLRAGCCVQPFHVACAGGHVECAKLLMDAGCGTPALHPPAP